jgi:sulfatase modifying factor 1
MGSNDFYPEEAPAHQVSVDGSWMDQHPVTVAEFRRFVKSTGHMTLAEQTRTPPITPTRIQRCWSPVPWSSERPTVR